MKHLSLLFIFFFQISLTGKAQEALNYQIDEQNLVAPELFRERLFNSEFKSDIRYVKSAELTAKIYTKAYPQIQMILMFKEHLTDILMAYSKINSTNQVQKYADLSRKSFPPNSFYNKSPEKIDIHLYISTDGKFQVEGVENDRVAINTGREILIHGNALARMDSMTPHQVVQLLLHELLHADKVTTLEVKDKFSTEVAKWLESQTSLFQLKNKNIFWFIKIDEKAEPPERFTLRNFYQNETLNTLITNEYLKKSFLAITQNSFETRFEDQFYSSFKSFDGFLNGDLPVSYFVGAGGSKYRLSLPLIQLETPRLSSTGTLVFDYSQLNVNYKAADDDDFQRGEIQLDPPLKFKTELNLEGRKCEVRRTYPINMIDGSFALDRIVKMPQSNYLSLRVHADNLSELIKSPEFKFTLFAKDLNSLSTLTYESQKINLLNPQEALIDFELAPYAMELSQLIIPEISTEIGAETKLVGFYKEHVFRSKERILLEGSASSPIQKIESAVEINETGGVTIKIQSDLKIKSVILDVLHVLNLQKPRWDGGLMQSGIMNDYGLYEYYAPTDDAGIQAMGRKYQLSGKDLVQLRQGGTVNLTFAVPAKAITMRANGPAFFVKPSPFGPKYKLTAKANVIIDTGNREISNIWVQFEDGTTLKLKSHPKNNFSVFKNDDSKNHWIESIQ